MGMNDIAVGIFPDFAGFDCLVFVEFTGWAVLCCCCQKNNKRG
jgi:hypothetical protein